MRKAFCIRTQSARERNVAMRPVLYTEGGSFQLHASLLIRRMG